MKRMEKRTALALRVAVMALGIVSILITGAISHSAAPYTFEGGADIALSAARSAYAQDASNDNLYTLLLGLCRQTALNGRDEASAQEMRVLGTELYARAKARTLDLEEISDPEQTTQMLRVLNDLGIKP